MTVPSVEKMSQLEMPWKCTDSVITAYPQFIWPFDGINDLCWATISYQMTRARRLSGLRLGSLTMARGPAWSAPTPPITRQTCSNTWRRDMYRLKAIIARFVRSFVQIPSLWKTTNPGVPTKVRGLLFETKPSNVNATSCSNLLYFSNNCTIFARQRICGQLDSK